MPGSAGAETEKTLERLQFLYLEQLPDITFNIGGDIGAEPGARGDIAVMNRRVASAIQQIIGVRVAATNTALVQEESVLDTLNAAFDLGVIPKREQHGDVPFVVLDTIRANGFGVMANVYDPFDIAANAAGIGFAVLVDMISWRVLTGSSRLPTSGYPTSAST